MARLESVIADYLVTIPAITAIVDQRVLDFDYRAFGWNTAPVQVLDPTDRLIMPTLVVDDAGASKPLDGPNEARVDRIQVWGFATRSTAGVDAIDSLMRLVEQQLDGWQDPESRALLRYVDRQGKAPVEDGVLDRVFFRVAGVPLRG